MKNVVPRNTVSTPRGVTISKLITACPKSVTLFRKYGQIVQNYEYCIPMSKTEYDLMHAVNKLLRQPLDVAITILIASQLLK